MASVALVSVTLNAVNPMTDYFHENAPELEIRNYLDSQILSKVKQEGGINDGTMRRMFDMLSTAAFDGADAILMTCTIFSPYAPMFSKLLSKPVICPDKAMLDQVAARDGKKVILCTFTGTVQTTHNMYISCCREQGRPEDVDMVVLPEAYEAVSRGDFATFDRIIQEKAKELDEQYDTIAFAQISMARAASGLQLNHAKLFTSPDSAFQMVKSML